MFKIEKDQNHICTLIMDTPGRSANVMNDEFFKNFKVSLEKIFSDTELKGLIITSAKKDFMAGGDLEYIYKIKTHEECMKLMKVLHETLRFLETRGKPVVAALNGTTLGGGLELALACHYRICLNDNRIQIGLPEVTLGLLPGGGGTQRLPRLIGIQSALEPLTTGNKLNPEKALKLGVINELSVTAEEMHEKAKAWIIKNPQAQQPWDDKKFKIPGGGIQSPMGYQVLAASNAMVAEKTLNNYPAPKAILSCIYEGLQVPFDTALQIESRYFSQLATGAVAKNMIKSLFFGIQSCNKGSARPKDIPTQTVKKVGILGAGMMGQGIAYVSANAGINVVLKDVTIDSAERGKAYTAKICDSLVEKGRMSLQKREEVLSRIQITTDPKAVSDCDLIIETVIEDRKIKAKVTQESEEVCTPTTIVASNTSTLPITSLAQASKRPQNFIGLHFFSPVDKMPLIEIIMGEKTDKLALAKCIDYSQQVKKTPIVVNDGRGFYTSRVFTTYISEGISLLKEGVLPTLIENAGKSAGMPVGPLAVADEVSIDLIYHIMKQTIEDEGPDSVNQDCYEVSKLFVEKLKRLGRKSGGAFYEYPIGGKKFIWPQLAEYFSLKKEQPNIEEIKERILYIQALESARCLEEKILLSSTEGDVGSILGWGFPAYTGGTLSYIDMVGVQKFVERCQYFSKKYGSRFNPNRLLLEKAKKGELVSQ